MVSITAIFRYSAVLLHWKDSELENLYRLWTQILKTAWTVPQATAGIIFHAPKWTGALQLDHPRVILGREAWSFIASMRETEDMQPFIHKKINSLSQLTGCGSLDSLLNWMKVTDTRRCYPEPVWTALAIAANYQTTISWPAVEDHMEEGMFD
eukprot:3179563-Rhodomonas_salina.1